MVHAFLMKIGGLIQLLYFFLLFVQVSHISLFTCRVPLTCHDSWGHFGIQAQAAYIYYSTEYNSFSNMEVKLLGIEHIMKLTVLK